MLRLTLSLLAAAFLVSCSKETDFTKTPAKLKPNMRHLNLGGQTVKYGAAPVSVDLSQDGNADLVFGIWLVGDPVSKEDKYQFRVSSTINRLLAVNAHEETASLNCGDDIPPGSFRGFQWFDIASLVLIQKVVTDHALPVWEGSHKKDGIQYLPVQVIDHGQRFNGWVSLSVDIANERIILHAAALCAIAEQTVTAGK